MGVVAAILETAGPALPAGTDVLRLLSDPAESPGRVPESWTAGQTAIASRRASPMDFAAVRADASGMVAAALEGEVMSSAEPEAWAANLATEYHRIGVAAIAHLEGTFCGVVWDARARHLDVFTDRFGLGIVYWALVGSQVVVSTRLRSFLTYPGFQPALDDAAVTDLLNYGFVTGTATILRGVSLVPPGTCLRFSADCATPAVSRYWTPTFGVTPVNEDEVCERYEDAMQRAVRLYASQYRGRWGVTLSGGLDSRAISSVHRRAGHEPLMAVTYGSRTSNEYKCAAAVAAALRLDHALIELRPEEMAAGYSRAIWCTDGMAAVSDLYMAGRFSDLGRYMDVRLDGFLGDALWGGTYLRADILAARTFDDCTRWLASKLCRWGPWHGLFVSPTWQEHAAASRTERLRAIWNQNDVDGAPRDRCEWLLYLTRGRRYIHQHHGVLYRDVLVSVRPFMDYGCMDVTWLAPAEQRLSGLYSRWLNTYHGEVARLPVAEPRSSRSENIRAYVRRVTNGRLCATDPRVVEPDGWNRSRDFRTAVKKTLLDDRTLSRSYVNADGLRRFLGRADGRRAFPSLAGVYQLEWIHRLFIEGEKVA